MTLEKTFRYLVIFVPLSIIASLASGLLTVLYGPPTDHIELQISALNLVYFDVEKALGGNAEILILVILPILYLVSLFLLYRFVSLGKPLYTVLFFVGTIMELTSGPLLFMPWDLLLYSIMTGAEIAILIFLYFTPIKQRFVR